jgi:hypothetical protein
VIVAEAGRVIAAGGTVTVLVRKADKWRDDPLPAGADMVESGRLLRGYRPAVARLLVERIPRGLIRVCLPGPLSGFRARVRSFHRRRVARPIHRRLARLYHRNPAKARSAVHRDLLGKRSIGLVVVGDAESMVTASELRDVIAASGARLAYTAAHGRPPAGHVKGRNP